ncbi:MAG: YebC/PmpR family DNA-binding transcriptional regulator [Candidatus Parcubacteria bacterium]|nr:YebC/PmpR family DNA-binding transcriptional regulator [Candidatus Parcubacteria bacterium]
MSGHSKWSQIKHQKGAADAKKSQVFSKLARMISVATRKGENPEMNSELRMIVEKAKSINMPLDNIERAIKRGSGKTEGSQLENVRYEAYGPGGSAIIIEAITDSKNRSLAEIKHLLSLYGAKLGTQGSVLWAFENKNPPAGGWEPKTTIELSETDAQILDKLLEALDGHEDVQEIYINAL